VRPAQAACVIVFAVTSIAPLWGQQFGLPSARPEDVGFSSERLGRVKAGMRRLVDDKEVAGILTLVARSGKVVHSDVYGLRDVASRAPLTPDTIFRIYSMTKPITGVAMMMLYEDGKWDPRDPIAKHLPELANLKVFERLDDNSTPVTKAPAHPPTMGELMTHTAGFSYGFFGGSAVDKLYQADNPLAAPTAAAFVTKLRALPLLYEPGEQWVYSVSVDVQGAIVEKLSGQSLPDFMRTRIFEPLGMVDTAFSVPAAKLSRLATIYAMDQPTRQLNPVPRDPNVNVTPGFASGGGGLYSTASDYLRFAQMLANGGELNGRRLLAPGTVALMRANHLPERLKTGRFGIGFQQMRPGFGFGYDVAVFDEPHKTGSMTGAGTYLWDGAAGTWFWIDPTNDIVFVGMIQRMAGPGSPNAQDLSRTLVHQALVGTRAAPTKD
jgi:CubicO group peptidase (beta-lactamase class C family)